MTTVTVEAPAKVNLTLNVEGRRADGYHLLSSVFQSISLCDTLTLTTAKEGIALSLSDPMLPCDERNTAFRAAAVFFEATGLQSGVQIAVDKHIPQQAGLGGGSADAAGVLVGLNALFDTALSTETLCALGARVGADVPFCVQGGTAMVRGIGEILQPAPPLPPCTLVVAKPPCGVSTAAAYALVDEKPFIPADQEQMLAALAAGDLKAVGALLSNAFEQVMALPEVAALRVRMADFSPLGITMSGSGSAVFALFDDAAAANACAHSLCDLTHDVCVPRSCGAAVVTKE